MKICFLCPSTKLSGGVKVIFRLAAGLTAKGVEVVVAVQKYNNKYLSWYSTGKPEFDIIEVPQPSYHTLPDCHCLVNFGDGLPFSPLPNIPHVLYLQGYGTQQYEKECLNLMYPYTAVITTSNWLADIVTKLGHANVTVIPPGIDPIFKPLAIPKCHVPAIGTLYHESPAKNFSLFEAGILKFVSTNKQKIHPIILSSKNLEKVTSFDEYGLPYGIITNPPQLMMPALYSSCSAWISPSLNEGHGLTTLEAMACGCPVISVRNFGLDKFLRNEKNCLIVKDKTDVAEGLATILSNSGTRNAIIEGGRHLAASFTWENTIGAFLKTLQNILK
jgi:glycosyltransferase involved in cell wall biosynthesis